MTTTKTAEIGTIYSLTPEECQQATPEVELGGDVTLAATWVSLYRGAVRYRSWYVQGNRGMISVEATDEDTCLAACKAWLAANGYRQTGEMPPECYEYSR